MFPSTNCYAKLGLSHKKTDLKHQDVHKTKLTNGPISLHSISNVWFGHSGMPKPNSVIKMVGVCKHQAFESKIT